MLFARVETILPAPESSHAIRVAIDEALKCKETGEEKTILFGLTGTGYFDMAAYTSFMEKTMTDYIPTCSPASTPCRRSPAVRRNPPAIPHRHAGNGKPATNLTSSFNT